MIRRSRSMVVLALLAGLLVAPVSTTSAVAQPVEGCANFDALGPAGAFAEFIHHNASRLSDSEGRVAIGGDATLGSPSARVGFTIGSGQPVDSVGIPLPPDPNRHDLIVGGALDAFHTVLINGGARYGSLVSGSSISSQVSGASITAGPPTEFADGSGPLDFNATFDDLEGVIDAVGHAGTDRHHHGDSISDGAESAWHRPLG